jgi:hypothetical protein
VEGSAAVAQAAPPRDVAQVFDQEPVDSAWKARTEVQVRNRVPGAEQIECHSTLCKITLVGTNQDLGAAISQMQSDRSLRGVAQSILLTAPAAQSDGKLALRAYAQFER